MDEYVGLVIFILVMFLIQNWLQSELHKETRMTLKDDLQTAVAAIKTNQAAVAQAITDEIARVEATIAALKSASGSVDDATAIADLTTVSSNLSASATTLAAEDPTPSA